MTRRDSGRPVFDASAVLALLQDEAGSDTLQPLQRHGVVSAVNAAEVLAKLVSKGMPLPMAQAAFDALHLDVVPFDASMAENSARHVGRDISLGDRCFLAAAKHYGPGWTADRDLADAPGVQAVSLKFFR